MTKLIYILAFVFSVNTSNGQVKTFIQLDKATNIENQVLITNNVSFLNNSLLDFNKSSNILDSILWFLKKQPRTIIQLNLMKYKPTTISSTYSQNSLDQLTQIKDYLSEKGINSKRLISAVCYGGPDSNDSAVIKVRIRVISHDFAD